VGSVIDGVGLLAPLAEDCAGKPLPSSLARRLKSVRSLTRPGQRRAILCWIARSARRGSRWKAAFFVVARRREACRLAPPQYGGARSAQRSQLTAEPRASPAFARTRRSSRARRSASKEEMLDPSSTKAASQAASNRAARSTVARWRVL
jgi:hypothetical protein